MKADPRELQAFFNKHAFPTSASVNAYTEELYNKAISMGINTTLGSGR